jgi:hypothetical protein
MNTVSPDFDLSMELLCSLPGDGGCTLLYARLSDLVRDLGLDPPRVADVRSMLRELAAAHSLVIHVCNMPGEGRVALLSTSCYRRACELAEAYLSAVYPE